MDFSSSVALWWYSMGSFPFVYISLAAADELAMLLFFVWIVACEWSIEMCQNGHQYDDLAPKKYHKITSSGVFQVLASLFTVSDMFQFVTIPPIYQFVCLKLDLIRFFSQKNLLRVRFTMFAAVICVRATVMLTILFTLQRPTRTRTHTHRHHRAHDSETRYDVRWNACETMWLWLSICEQFLRNQISIVMLNR